MYKIAIVECNIVSRC